MPAGLMPIIVAGSGFRTPYYRYIEDRCHWQWIGRIRGRNFVRGEGDKD